MKEFLQLQYWHILKVYANFEGEFISAKKHSKIVPLRHTDTKGESSYSSYSFTSALDGGEWSASRPGTTVPPGKERPVPTVQEAG
jgi:hypothetical protein